MSSLRVSSWIAAALVALPACNTKPAASAGPPAAIPRTLGEALTAARSETGAPGAAVAIVKDGALVFEGESGDAAQSPLRPFGTTTLSSLAGITEMATAGMILRLAEQGRLGLDDPFARYVPYVPGADRITVRMLLNHTAGLPDYTSSLSFDELDASFRDPAHVWTRDEILRALDPDDDLRVPGQGYRYSGTDYIALGAVLERASGAHVDALFDQLTAPLGLRRCTFAMDPALAPDVAHSFAYDNTKHTYQDSVFPPNGSVPTSLWGPVWTDSGILCTAAEAARFTDALFRGKLVSSDVLAQMTTFGSDGYGLGVAEKTDGAHPVYGHAGSRAGYTAAAWYDPAQRLTIVALVNADSPTFLAGTVYERMDAAYAGGATP